MPVLTVRHLTEYRYTRPVAFGEHRVMFRPRDSYDQRLLDADIAITPRPTSLRWLQDVFGNCVAIVQFAGRAEALRFESTIRLDHSPANVLDFAIEDHAQTYPFAYGAEDMPDLMRCIERQYLDPDHAVDRWARQFVTERPRCSTYNLLVAMTCAIKRDFQYRARTEKGVQDPILTLELGSGSCRDFAMLMIEAVRALGMAARFVSGYLYVPSRDGSGRVGGGSSHAWLQIYLPGAGWVEFDPTNGIVGNRDLIRVAVARDPRQAIPLWGTWYGEASDYVGMTTEVHVTAAADVADAARAADELPQNDAAMPRLFEDHPRQG
ncbi:MAG TPA: transglutaminase family protein [Stellaceae bacterium]|nr:transglutaminase family protein [Stellaceae bacterium]